jgi:hypothetical protein
MAMSAWLTVMKQKVFLGMKECMKETVAEKS